PQKNTEGSPRRHHQAQNQLNPLKPTSCTVSRVTPHGTLSVVLSGAKDLAEILRLCLRMTRSEHSSDRSPTGPRRRRRPAGGYSSSSSASAFSIAACCSIALCSKARMNMEATFPTDRLPPGGTAILPSLTIFSSHFF